MGNAANTIEDVFINNRLVSYSNTSQYMYAKLVEIFTYKNLPLTVPQDVLETWLTQNGFAIAYMHEGDLFITNISPSGKSDIYDRPTEVHINRNDGVHLDRTIGVDAVLIKNDTGRIGIDPIVAEYAALTAQAKISMLNVLVNLRTQYVLQAKDQSSYESALEFENQKRTGNMAVVLAEEFGEFEGLEFYQTPTTGQPATQTIELYQYIQSMYYSELGITLNNNMKREYVSDSELEKSSGMPLIVNMLRCRQEAIRDINALFDLDIEVCLSEQWNDEQEEDLAEHDPTAAPGEPDAADDAPAGEGEGADDAPAGGDQEARGDAAAEAPAEAEPEEEDPVDEVTKEELIDATEALLGEEVNDGDATDSPSDSPDSDGDTDEDEAERGDVEPEEDND